MMIYFGLRGLRSILSQNPYFLYYWYITNSKCVCVCVCVCVCDTTIMINSSYYVALGRALAVVRFYGVRIALPHYALTFSAPC
jgi:hypothetical protein